MKKLFILLMLTGCMTLIAQTNISLDIMGGNAWSNKNNFMQTGGQMSSYVTYNYPIDSTITIGGGIGVNMYNDVQDMAFKYDHSNSLIFIPLYISGSYTYNNYFIKTKLGIGVSTKSYYDSGYTGSISLGHNIGKAFVSINYIYNRTQRQYETGNRYNYITKETTEYVINSFPINLQSLSIGFGYNF